MASFEGYRSPPPHRPDGPPYPQQPDPRAPPGPPIQHPPPQQAMPAFPPYPADFMNGRPRGTSSARPDVFPTGSAPPPPPPPAPPSAPPAGEQTHRYTPTSSSSSSKPINDAVNSAFSKNADNAGRNYPPELVSQMTAQITEDVINRLRASGLDSGASSFTQSHPRAMSQSSASSRSRSDSTSPPLPAGAVRTPPSPRNKPEFPVYGTSPRSNMPTSPHGTTPRPWREQAPPPQRPQAERRNMSPDSASMSPSRSRKTRDTVEETPLDRKWGQLFNESRATDRMGQFFRGLANYIISDFEPKKSIVVTPVKMLKYYEMVKLEHEVHPWNAMFRELHPSRLGRVYQELECQHHLVQERHYGENPAIPGLTPIGFDRWMTMLMLSDPEREWERMQKTILEMPINNADDASERYPKEISRHLFPEEEDWKMRSKLDKAFSVARKSGEDVQPEPRRGRTMSPKPGQAASKPEIPRPEPSVTLPPSLSASYSNIERERKPYSKSPSNADEDESGPTVPPKIERERQPYSAQPGSGRTYEDTRGSSQSHLERSQSASKARPMPSSMRPNNDMPPPSSHFVPEGAGHYRAASSAAYQGRGRHRSPSSTRSSVTGDPFRRSDNDIIGRESAIDDDLGDSRRPPPRRMPDDDGPPKGFEPPRFDRNPAQAPLPPPGPPGPHGPPRRGYEEDFYRPGPPFPQPPYDPHYPYPRP